MTEPRLGNLLDTKIETVNEYGAFCLRISATPLAIQFVRAMRWYVIFVAPVGEHQRGALIIPWTNEIARWFDDSAACFAEILFAAQRVAR